MILCYPNGNHEFLAAFLACLLCGVIAVPIYPPNPASLKRALAKLDFIIRSCEAKMALTNSKFQAYRRLSSITNKWPSNIEWIATDRVPAEPKKATAAEGREQQGGSAVTQEWRQRMDSVAFLQYTSGSTGDPKGVMITLRNLSHNLYLLGLNMRRDYCSLKLQSGEQLSDIRLFSWLPICHDLGLCHTLVTLLFGGTIWRMSPIAFIKNPMLWLTCVSNFKAHFTAGPTFACDLAVRKFTEVNLPRDFDLSHIWAFAVSAEPIRRDIIEKFCQFFAKYGFRRVSLTPAYGLAEHVMVVCVSEEPDLVYSQKDERLVCCGSQFAVQLLVVDPETHIVCPEQQEGEIWVASDSKPPGYWKLPELSRDTFHAEIAAPAADNPYVQMEFVRTGDCGFLENGKLYFCSKSCRTSL